MATIRQLTMRSAIVREAFTFLWERKLWWLLPFAVVIVVLGILFALAQLSSIAPWMYPL
jgi:Family of unknown function (DUF5989)